MHILGPMANTKTATLIREEFEEWFDANRDDIMDRLDQRPRSLGNWIIAFAKSVALQSEDHGHEDDDGIDSAFGGDEGIPDDFADLGDD